MWIFENISEGFNAVVVTESHNSSSVIGRHVCVTKVLQYLANVYRFSVRARLVNYTIGASLLAAFIRNGQRRSSAQHYGTDRIRTRARSISVLIRVCRDVTHTRRFVRVIARRLAV